MTVDHIRMLYDYNYWAHRLVWGCVMGITDEQFERQLGYSWGSIHAQVVHVMSAEWMWFSRLRGTSPKAMFDPNDYPNRESVLNKWNEIEVDIRDHVSSLSEDYLDGLFTYTTTSGNTYTQPIVPILLHVINHGTDHRAQILAMLNQLGGETVEQDLIFYLREKAEKY
jgi:uncharacterized damage-inducible protein DinB